MDSNTLTVVLAVVQVLTAGGATILWSIITDLKSQAKQTHQELSDYKVQVAREYASQEQVDRLIMAMNKTVEQHTVMLSERFNRIEAILDRMRDRE